MKHLTIKKNKTGRDFFIGDIHGHKAKFNRALDRVGFNAEQGDRLFCTGDLIDRGDDNLQILGNLKHWDNFYSIVGNHEMLLMNAFCESPITQKDMDYPMPNDHTRNGGKWFAKLPQSTRDRVYQQIKKLPLSIEVETQWGKIGLVHAEVPLEFKSWESFVMALKADKALHDDAVWSRNIIKGALHYEELNEGLPPYLTEPLAGIDCVIHGHTLVNAPKRVGNRLYIDTGLKTGELTILSAEDVFNSYLSQQL